MLCSRPPRRRAALSGAFSLAALTLAAGPAVAQPPAPTFSFTPQPNAAGWTAAPVAVTVTCQAAFTPEPAALGPFAVATPFEAACVDPAGGTRSTGSGTSPQVDLSDPSIVPGLSPPAPDGANGWYRTSPLLSFVCTDIGSGTATCPAQERLPDGAGPWVRSTRDNVGRTGSVAVTAPVDTTPPPMPVITVPMSGATYEIGVPQTAAFGCGPDATSGVASCVGTYAGGAPLAAGGALDVGVAGNPGTLGPRSVSVAASDVAGNRSSRSVSYTVVDTGRPVAPVLANPAPDAVTSQRSPSFTWAASSDAGAGLREYRINVGGKNYSLPASASMQPGFVLPDVLADGVYEWQVFAVDQAGNASASTKRRFRVDPTAVSPPVITQGPQGGGATANRTPTFAFTGLPGSTFSWRTLNAADEPVPGGSGGGPGPVTLPALADGTYSFALSQVNALGQPSEPAVALFRVDTQPPPAPRITAAPTITVDTQPSFAWAPGEPGGSFTWEILNPAGTLVMGPATTTDTAVRIPAALAGGAYSFRVRQTDPAGNPGPWSANAPFTVVGGPNGGGPATGGGRILARPATKNARFMTPRVGAKLVATRAITLKWRNSRTATLYNVQVFRLRGTRYTKVLSAFPRTASYRLPKNALRPGQRYAWRVWPYDSRLRKYARTPAGISWFDTRPRPTRAR